LRGGEQRDKLRKKGVNCHFRGKSGEFSGLKTEFISIF
jgi:hypothetical protein